MCATRKEGPGQAPPPLRVRDWLDNARGRNAFLDMLSLGLTSAGCEVGSAGPPWQKPDTDCDILLLHWLDSLFWDKKPKRIQAGRAFDLCRWILGLPKRVKLVWIVHNIEPHDVTPFQRALWKMLVRIVALRVDGILTLSPTTLDVVRAGIPALRRKPGLGVNHPAYPISVEAGARAEEVRRSTGVGPSDLLVGYAGMLRPYKGLESLAHAASGPDAPHLLIAGLGDRDYAAMLQAAGNPERMTIRRGRLDETEFDAVLTACDLVVAPFRRYLHSGSLVHALSAGRPVLTPASPFAAGLAADVGSDWVRTYDGELTAEVLDRALVALPEGKPDLSAFSPETVGGPLTEWLRGLR